MSSLGARIRLGVIDDAWTRQRRHRRRGLSLLLAAIIVGLVAYAVAASGERVHYRLPAAGRVTGSLQLLSSADYQLWVTPDLFPGDASVDINLQTPGESFYTSLGAYAGAGMPIGEIGPLGWVRAPVGQSSDADYVLIVAPNVAAVRIGSLGIASARSTSALPVGDKVVAFVVPHNNDNTPPRQAPEQTITLLDSLGFATRTLAPPGRPARLPEPIRPRVQPWTAIGGRCAANSTLPGLTDAQPLSSTTITPLATTVPGLFLSCLDDKYAYDRAKFNVAILLNARHPGQRPAALWGTTTIAGKPGLVEIKAPPQFPTNQDSSSPLFARRVDDAWLVVQARPGFARNPGTAQTIQVLDAMRITRIDLQRHN
jgi:hypothetical protein